MGLKVPKNQIVTSKYTSGGEYVTDKEYKNYQGYYYELNNKVYVGKEFNTTASILLKANSPDVNKLITNPFTSIYGAISGIKIINSIVNSLPNSSSPNLTDVVDASSSNMNDTLISLNTPPEKTKFYCSKVNSSPILIKEIDKQNYTNLQNDPLYKTTFIGTYNNKNQTPDEAEKQLPGIKAFLDL
jgi:hypothetical protein